MKQLFFILILTIGFVLDINSHSYKQVKELVPEGITTLLLEEVVVTSTKLKKTIMPSSFIADYIFDRQLHVESRSQQFIKGKDGKLVLIKSRAGALGIAQFLPSTWEWLKKRKVLPQNFSIENERHQRAAQRLFMNTLAKRDYGIKYNKVKLALAAYNAGSGRVTRLIKKYGNEWEDHLPNETKRYIKIIIS